MGALVIGGVLVFWRVSTDDTRNLRVFCDSLPDDLPADKIVDRAHAAGLSAFAARGAVVVLNHEQTENRVGCDIEFNQGRIVGRKIIPAP